jgi:hypothetical protein
MSRTGLAITLVLLGGLGCQGKGTLAPAPARVGTRDYVLPPAELLEQARRISSAAPLRTLAKPAP